MIYLKDGFYLKFVKNMIFLWINFIICLKFFFLKFLEVRVGVFIFNLFGFSVFLFFG